MEHSVIDQYLSREEEARWEALPKSYGLAELATAARIPLARLRGRFGAENVLFCQDHGLHPRVKDLDAANDPRARRAGYTGTVLYFTFTSLYPELLADENIERVHRALTSIPRTRLSTSEVAESVGVDAEAVRRYYERYGRRVAQRPLAGTSMETEQPPY